MKSDEVTLNRLEKYYHEEVNSYFNSTRLNNNEEVALKNVGQALLWGAAILEFYEKKNKDFSEWAKMDEASHVIMGFKYARNRVVHQFLQLLHISNGAVFPIEFPAPFFEICWLPLESLPNPDKGHEHKSKAEAYKRGLENKSVRFTFETLDSFFARAKFKF